MLLRVVDGLLTLLMAGLMACLIAWQVATGKKLDRYYQVWLRRSGRPVLFWLLIAFESVVTGIMVYCAIVFFRRP